MIISCPNCGRKYSVDDSKLKPKKKLRCVACESVWEHMSDDENLLAEHFIKDEGEGTEGENFDDGHRLTEETNNEVLDQENTLKDNNQYSEEKAAPKRPQPNAAPQKKEQKSSSVALSVSLLVLLVIGCGLGWYFRDLILFESRNFYENNMLKSIFGVVAKSETLPKIEDLSTNIKGDKLLVKGVVANRTNNQTKYKFLRLSITPNFRDVFQLALKNPSKLMEIRETYYIKLDKKLLERNEKVDFSTNLDLFGVKNVILKMEICNLE